MLEIYESELLIPINGGVKVKIALIFSIPESMLIFKPAKYWIANSSIACETNNTKQDLRN